MVSCRWPTLYYLELSFIDCVAFSEAAENVNKLMDDWDEEEEEQCKD